MPVYFIHNENSCVKIGRSADPARRLRFLQCGAPDVLSLIRVVDGDIETEKWLHERFAEHHIRGEWFKFHEDMLTASPPEVDLPVVIQYRNSSPREIIALWRAIDPRAHVEAFARDIDVRKLTAHAWIRRGSIPSTHWASIIEAAVVRGFPITWKLLAGAADSPRVRRAA